MQRLKHFLFSVCSLALSGPALAVQAAEELRFEVFLNDRPIGEHRFRIADSGKTTRVSSRAAFDVDFLFINAYRYRHSSLETFRDGCLVEIDARTDDNGKQLEVEGEIVGGGFRVEGPEGIEQTDGCLKTFAYWDKSFLEQERLLNPQTGDLVQVRVEPAGSERVTVGDGQQIAAKRYALQADDLVIDLWYNDELGWVGLKSEAGKGRNIIYRRM
jgi:hypothetical protein